eukprot:9013093-Pyramimonas_sp.AAC.1
MSGAATLPDYTLSSVYAVSIKRTLKDISMVRAHVSRVKVFAHLIAAGKSLGDCLKDHHP